MTALECMTEALKHLGSVKKGTRDDGGRFVRATDLFDALSIAGENNPEAVISSFHFLRLVTEKENLLAWHSQATAAEMRNVLHRAIDVATIQ